MNRQESNLYLRASPALSMSHGPKLSLWRNTDTQSAPRQPGSHEPGHKAERKRRARIDAKHGEKKTVARLTAI